MRVLDILSYLIGREDAIRRVASSRTTLTLGFVLVLMAGIAREYDQTYIPHLGIRFLLPVGTSLLAAVILYGLLSIILPSKGVEHATPTPPGGFLCFLGLFWMTAPLAWVYAFPAEHLFPPREAAWINIGLLAFVATARVLVLSRALSVLMEISFMRVLSSILCVSSLILGIGSIVAFMSLIRIMGGLRYSPEEEVLGTAASFAFFLSIGGLIIFTIVCISMASSRKEKRKDLTAPANRGALPWVFLCVTALVWVALLIPQQRKLARNHRADELVQAKDHAGLIAFLSQHKSDEFSKVRRLPPNPFEDWGLEDLPGVIHALDGTEAPWVREMYLDYLDIALNHHHFRYMNAMILSLSSVLRQPNGDAWIRARSKRIEALFEHDWKPTLEMSILVEKLKAIGLKIAIPAELPKQEP